LIAYSGLVGDWLWNSNETLMRFLDAARAQTLDVYLGTVYSVNMFGVRDPQLAYEHWQAALEGAYPEGAQDDLGEIRHRLDDEMRARLAPVIVR
jgi:hypothetical protein